MYTRKLAITLGALLSTGVLMAQAPDQTPQSSAPQATAHGEPARPHHEPDPQKQAKHLGKKLNLSQDQVAQIEPILAARHEQMEQLHADTSLSQPDRRAKAKGIMEDTKTKIEAVLNDQQKQQFEQMLAQRRSHHHA